MTDCQAGFAQRLVFIAAVSSALVFSISSCISTALSEELENLDNHEKQLIRPGEVEAPGSIRDQRNE